MSRPSRRDFDGKELVSGSVRLEIWEPGWWQLGRWWHWWKFRRYHGHVVLTIPRPGPYYGMPEHDHKIRLRVIPSRAPSLLDPPRSVDP